MAKEENVESQTTISIEYRAKTLLVSAFCWCACSAHPQYRQMDSFIKLITTKSGFDFQSYLQQHKMQIVLIASEEIYLAQENLINMNNRNRHIMRCTKRHSILGTKKLYKSPLDFCIQIITTSIIYSLCNNVSFQPHTNRKSNVSSLHKKRTQKNARKNLLLPFYGVYFLSFDWKVLNDKQDIYAR